MVHSSKNFKLICQHFKLISTKFCFLNLFNSSKLIGLFGERVVYWPIWSPSYNFNKFIIFSDGTFFLLYKLKRIDRYFFEIRSLYLNSFWNKKGWLSLTTLNSTLFFYLLTRFGALTDILSVEIRLIVDW